MSDKEKIIQLLENAPDWKDKAFPWCTKMPPKEFNNFHFNLFCKYYGIKENPKLCYQHQLTHTYGYSIQTIDFIVDEIKKDPENIIQNIRNLLSKK